METFKNRINSIKDIDLSSSAQLALKQQDIDQVWHQISLFIDTNMLDSRGISLPGFGTFSFFQQKLVIGNNKHVLIQRPLFVISQKFAQTHRLRLTKRTVSGNIPVQGINYTLISSQAGLGRDYVQMCVKHVLQVFNQSLMTRGKGELNFESIGKLVVSKGYAEMVFLPEFISGFDEARKVITNPDEYLKKEITSLSKILNPQSPKPELEVLDFNEDKVSQELLKDRPVLVESKPNCDSDQQSVASSRTPRSIKSILMSHKSVTSEVESTRKVCLLAEDEEHDFGPCSHREVNSPKKGLYLSGFKN